MPTHEDTCTALAICLVANQPTVLWGPPGQGKSSVMEQISEDLTLYLETVIASLREPADFAGLPAVNEAEKSVDLYPPSWAKRMNKHGQEGGLLFFDEIGDAPDATQSAMMRVVHERWVGDLLMHDAVRVVAAANPPDQATDGYEMRPALVNRFTHLWWSLDAATVRDGFAMGWKPFEVPNPDPVEVQRLLADTMILVGAFLGVRPETVTVMPKKVSATPGTLESAVTPYPTPRSWESAARLYATAKAARVNETVINLLLTGTIGKVVAGEFLHFLENLDLPDPEKLLEDPTRLVLDRTRNDKSYAIAASVWAATKNNNTAGRWENCGLILSMMAEKGNADIAFLYARHWAKNRPEGAYPGPEVTKFLAPIMSEMGYLQ